jgi:hypothetical protein
LTRDALSHPSNDLCVNLIVDLFLHLLNDIHPSDEDKEDINFTNRRSWTCSFQILVFLGNRIRFLAALKFRQEFFSFPLKKNLV